MLTELHINNVLLIKKLSLSFSNGFSVFTGETGAGKSILLDSLALALGERANFSLIRQGAEQGIITAVFNNEHELITGFLTSQNLPVEESIIIRRVLHIDGKSRAFINDVPVSVALLRKLGEKLLDIHGQFDNYRLINPAYHQDILDSFLPTKEILNNVAKAYENYLVARDLLESTKEEVSRLVAEKDYIEYSLNELLELKPYENEEQELALKRVVLNNSQRLEDIFSDIRKELVGSTMLKKLHKVLKQVDNAKKILGDTPAIEEFLNSVDATYTQLSNTIETFEDLASSLDFSKEELHALEERLIELRTIAKKHNTTSNHLTKLIDEFQEKLHSMDISDKQLLALQEDEKEKYDIYLNYARKLTALRQETAIKVASKVNKELEFLKLPHGEFKVVVLPDNYSKKGQDKVIFQVKTNKGSNFGDLNKIASGGEMARFMLALKMVLAEVDVISTLILDEIDIGVGGDVADAIGVRLANLANNIQTIVVTHSHQVASKGRNHYLVAKNIYNDDTITTVQLLNYQERVQEIARMLSGSIISQEALATATNLLENK